MTMQRIKHVELTSAQTSITFSSIPQTYTDLLLVFSLRHSYAGTFRGVNLSINGVSTDISTRYLYGDGTSASTGSLGGNGFMHDVPAANSTANTFSNTSYYFANYRSSRPKSFNQEVTNENNGSSTYMMLQAGLWNPSTNGAISTITLTATDSSNFLQNSSATLYGISAGNDSTTVVS
jgi:hypothetical protein